jgi:hypothetical protein
MKIIKLAQIWNVQFSEDDVGELILAVYELEYKLSMAKFLQFKGMPKRKENIINNLSKQTAIVANLLKNKLLEVYDNWLGDHALLDASVWADGRVKHLKDHSVTEKIESTLGELSSYSRQLGYSDSKDRSDFGPALREAMRSNNIATTEFFNKLAEEYIEENRVYVEEDLASRYDDVEYFNDEFDTELEDEDEIRDYISNMSDDELVEKLDLLSNFIDLGVKEFINLYGNEDKIIKFMNEYYVFPLWYEKWSAEGIDETRENIEEVRERLNKSNPNSLSSFLSDINIAINTAHQTGNMTDHMYSEYELEELLTVLTKTNTYTKKWNKDLKEVGFTVPEIMNQEVIAEDDEIVEENEELAEDEEPINLLS